MSTRSHNKKTEVSSSEVIDPHLRIALKLTSAGDAWNSGDITNCIKDLNVTLKRDGGSVIDGDDYERGDFTERDGNVADGKHQYKTDGDELVLYISFNDKNLNDHENDTWNVIVNLVDDELYNKDIPCHPKKPSI